VTLLIPSPHRAIFLDYHRARHDLCIIRHPHPERKVWPGFYPGLSPLDQLLRRIHGFAEKSIMIKRYTFVFKQTFALTFNNNKADHYFGRQKIEAGRTKPPRPEPPQGRRQNNKAIGELSEAIIRAKLLEVGFDILIPSGDNLRYDLVIEDADGSFWRIQCKTGRSNGEYISFAPASLYYHTRAGRTTHGSRSYHAQIDYFAVYCPETRGVYLIPVEDTGSSQMNLRLVPARNKQEKNIRWAREYEL
jgi:hypothetical protein